MPKKIFNIMKHYRTGWIFILTKKTKYGLLVIPSFLAV